MRIVLLFTVVLCISCNFQSIKCPNKDVFLSGYEDFINDVKEHHDKISGEQWTEIDEEFDLYVENCYPAFKKDMTVGEKVDFWKNTLQYAYYKNDNKELNISINLSDEFEELSIESKEELEKFVKEELGKDIEKALDDVMDGMKEISEEIKSWLKDR